MTITIDVCWMDHIGEWWNRHNDNILFVIVFIVTASAIPVDVYLLGALIGYFEYETGSSSFFIFSVGILYGLIGTIFFIIMSKVLLEDGNEKYKWFKIKHCKRNKK